MTERRYYCRFDGDKTQKQRAKAGFCYQDGALKFLSAKFGSTDLSLPPGATCVLIPGTSAPFDKWVCGAPEVRIHLAPPTSRGLWGFSAQLAEITRGCGFIQMFGGTGERHLPVICDGAVPGVAPVTGTPFSVRSSFIAPRSPRTLGVDLALRPTAAKSDPDTAVLRRGASSGAPKCIRGRCRELRASPGQQSSIARSPPTEPGRLFGRALRPRNEGPTSASRRRRVRPCDTSGSYREGSTFLTGRSCAFALG